jgi:hypothetical protein
MLGSLGYPLPKLPAQQSLTAQLWPRDVAYFDGVCAWNKDGSNAGCYMFKDRVSKSVELFASAHGVGVRATVRIESGEFIANYAGEVYDGNMRHAAADDNRYIMDPDDGSDVTYDAKCLGNESRMINDYRGMAASENVIMGERFVIHNWITARPIYASKRIEPGEELLLDYGDEYWAFFKMRVCTSCNQLFSMEANFSAKGKGDQEYKTCSKCDKLLPLNDSNFYRYAGRGFRNSCKSCHKRSDQAAAVVDQEYRTCTKCDKLLPLNDSNFYRYSGNVYRYSCISCNALSQKKTSSKRYDDDDYDDEPFKTKRVRFPAPSSSVEIGSLKELSMDAIDPENYRSARIPVTVMDNNKLTVGFYTDNGDLCTWSNVPPAALHNPRGPEMIKPFVPMDKVEVLDDQTGIWWEATVISADVPHRNYNVVWSAAFDGFSSISSVPERCVRCSSKK